MDHYEPSRSRRGAGGGYGRRDRDRDRPPPPPSYDDRPPPPPRGNGGDMFQFRGAANNRPSDNHRPNDRRDEGFNFSAGNGTVYGYGNAPSFGPSTNDYPGAHRRGPGAGPRDGRRPPPRGPRNNRGGFRRFGPKPAHDRDLMRREREPTPEQLEGMNGANTSRFKDVDDMSDSDSEAMDLETDDGRRSHRAASPSDSDDSEHEHPRAKRARVKSPAAKASVPASTSAPAPAPAAADNKPKWSNPDPYTVLPPPDETQTKKGKDVVQLIRKAKIEAVKSAVPVAESADFISLNFDDDLAQNETDEEGQLSSDSHSHPAAMSHKPSFSHLDNLHPDRNMPPPPSTTSEQMKGINMSLPSGNLDTWPPPPADPSSADPLGRAQYSTGLERQDARDTIAQARPDKKRKRLARDPGAVVDEWHSPEGTDPAPWFANEYAGPSAEKWLHNEILDFYNYVKPRDFEVQVRNDLIQRINTAVRQSFPNLNVHAFGSFASGLYLPTADMDLVACSTPFLNSGRSTFYPTKKLLYRFAETLKRADVADPSSVTVIAGARVPLVKFVEKTTGLRVDISFENDSGLVANKTFQVWKQQYPAMPVIVSLIKQFLVMRGLSEVFTGGLGGYSVICLVITTIRKLQKRSGRDWDAMQSLDTVLMTFLMYFGREFDVNQDGIQMEPWQIIDKQYWRTTNGKTSKADRLLIIDPNDYNNDISGGSAQVPKVFDKFAEAFKEINVCMLDAEDAHRQQGDVISILERVWGGNYELFEIQRDRLRSVWQKLARPGAGAPDGHNQGPPGNNGNNGNNHDNQPHQLPRRGPPPGPSGTQPKPANPGKSAPGPNSNKKQKMNNDDAGSKNDPLYVDSSDDSSDDDDVTPSGPAASAGLRRKAASDLRLSRKDKRAAAFANNPLDDPSQIISKNAKKKEKKAIKASKKEAQKHSDASRALSFKQSHPGLADVPDKLNKNQFKKLVKKHGRGNAPGGA